MPKYIDAEILTRRLNSPKVKAIVGVVGVAWVKALLAKIPEVDVVEVVRCCDCVHRRENPDIYNTCYLSCDKNCGLRGVVDPTDFCSYGKRKGAE